MIAFWIASGQRYIAEARQSATSVKRHMPQVKTWLFSPNETGGGFDHIEQVTPRRPEEPWFLDSVRYVNEAVDRLPERGDILWLDTDTYLCAPIPELFSLLERFDFCGAHAPGRQTAPTQEPLPSAFPEINVGVLLFKNVGPVRWLFRDWLDRYEAHWPQYGNNDQASLRESLWHSSLRWYVLPPEYDCRFPYGFGGVRAAIKILHGRNADMQALARRVNASSDFRAWDIGQLP